MPKLVILSAGESKTVELTSREFTVGRLPECEIHFDSNLISRKHARLRRDGTNVILEDLGSGNGTFVNGQRLTGPVTLQHNDRVKFGPVLTRFDDESQAQSGGVPLRAVREEQPDQMVEDVLDDSLSTIMGAASPVSGFGLLDVQPEAKLKAILEISRALAGTVSVESMLPRILDSLFSVFPAADRGCILLKNEADGKMVPRAMKHRRHDSDETVKLSRTVVATVMDEKKAILSADAGSDARFQAAESISSLSIRSMMCAPLLSLANEVMGMIHIDTQNPLASFRKDDLEILVAVAGQAALSYESARLLASFVEKQKQDNEMNIAAGVQRALLPEGYPSVKGYSFFATYEAAQAVGGDYYDIIPLPEGKICLAFGDVAGKGVPASLVMSRLSSAVRTTVEFVTQPDLAVARLNNHMCAKAVEGRFVTFVLIILDTVANTISLANAGHMSPMIRKVDGTIEEFDDRIVGVPLGVLEDFEYQLVQRTIEPGECVVVYTDGVSEAMNHQSDLYSIERLRDLISNSPGDVIELGTRIRVDVKKHANGRPQNDDITLMVFGRQGIDQSRTDDAISV